MTAAGELRGDRIGAGAASLALLASLLWGGNQVFIKIGLVGMPPLAMAAASEEGRLRDGTRVLLAVASAGISTALSRFVYRS